MLRSMFVLALFVLTFPSYAQTSYQFLQGKIELGFSGSFGSISIDSEMKSSTSSNATKHSDAITYFQLSVMPAVYLIDGFAFEPEIDLFFAENNKPAYSFLGNACYTVNIGKSNVAPFVKVGYGISNSLKIPINLGLVNRVSNELDVPIINIGTGAKVFLAENVMLRTELNYRIISYSYYSSYKSANYSYSNTSSYDYSFLSMLFGISVLL